MTKSIEGNDCYLIATIYYDKYVSNLITILKKFFKYGNVSNVVIVNNNNIAFLERKIRTEFPRRDIDIISHDNTGAEFGAYQRGLDYLNDKNGSDFDLIIINETLGKHYPFYNQQVRAFLRTLEGYDSQAYACGYIHQSERLFRIGRSQTNRWIQSNLIGFSASALKLIDQTLYHPSLDHHVLETSYQTEMFSGEIGAALREKLNNWLFRKEGGWYKAGDLTSDNCKFFAHKARSILQEIYLSMKLEEQEVAFRRYKLTPAERLIVRIKLLNSEF